MLSGNAPERIALLHNIIRYIFRSADFSTGQGCHLNHDFLTGVFNRRYFETEFCTRLDAWTDAHRCASLALVALDDEDGMRTRQGDAVMLLADNAAVCPPMFYAGEQLSELHIEGKAVGLCRGL